MFPRMIPPRTHNLLQEAVVRVRQSAAEEQARAGAEVEAIVRDRRSATAPTATGRFAFR
jgi:hypothetical protein